MVELRSGKPRDIHTVYQNGTFIRLKKTDNMFQQNGFAAPAASDDGGGFAFLNFLGNPPQNLLVVEPLLDIYDFNHVYVLCASNAFTTG